MFSKENILELRKAIQKPIDEPIAKRFLTTKITRLAAFAIDISVLGSILLFVHQFPHLIPYSKKNTTNALIPSFILLYFPLLEFFYGKTLGKVVTKSSVVSNNGNKINFFQALVRAFFRIAPVNLVLSLGKKPTNFHDRMSGTRVVKDVFLEIQQ